MPREKISILKFYNIKIVMHRLLLLFLFGFVPVITKIITKSSTVQYDDNKKKCVSCKLKLAVK